VLLVFDISNKKSLSGLEHWLEEIKKHCPEAFVILLGNKSDMCPSGDRQVSEAEAIAWAQEHHFMFFETSSKWGRSKSSDYKVGVEVLFSKLIDELVARNNTQSIRRQPISIRSNFPASSQRLPRCFCC